MASPLAFILSKFKTVLTSHPTLGRTICKDLQFQRVGGEKTQKDKLELT